MKQRTRSNPDLHVLEGSKDVRPAVLICYNTPFGGLDIHLIPPDGLPLREIQLGRKDATQLRMLLRNHETEGETRHTARK